MRGAHTWLHEQTQRACASPECFFAGDFFSRLFAAPTGRRTMARLPREARFPQTDQPARPAGACPHGTPLTVPVRWDCRAAGPAASAAIIALCVGPALCVPRSVGACARKRTPFWLSLERVLASRKCVGGYERASACDERTRAREHDAPAGGQR